MRIILLAVVTALLGSAADKKAEDAAAKAQEAAKAAASAVREASASRAKAGRDAASVAASAQDAAAAAAKLAAERTASLESSLIAIKQELQNSKASQSTERLKSTLQLAGVVIAALLGVWGVRRSGQIKQEMDGRFTEYAALIKAAAHAEGKLEGEVLVREVHRIEQMNRSGG